MLIYQLTMYLHLFTLNLQHIAPQESNPLFGFHDPIGATFNYGTNQFMEGFGQDMFFLVHIQPTPNVLYHFKAFEKLMATSKWLDGHLSYHVLK